MSETTEKKGAATAEAGLDGQGDNSVHKQEAANGTQVARSVSPGAEDTAKEASTAEDSDATVRSTSEDTSPQSARYGLRPKRSRLAKEGTPSEDGKEGKDGKGAEESLPNAGKHRRKRSQHSGKQTDASKPDGLLRLAQIAHAAPRLPKKQRGEAGKGAQGEPEVEKSAPAAAEGTDAAVNLSVSAEQMPLEVAMPTLQETLEAEGGAPASTTNLAPPPADYQVEQKITPAQIRAFLATGQPLNLPGFTPGPLPHVQMGARWQLDLRTGERLEEHPGPHMGMPGSYPNTGPPMGAQVLGPRPPIFTGPPPQPGQVPPPGGYGVVPPPNSYASSLPIPALGQQSLSQAGLAAGPYTALLGSQMQGGLLPPGIMPGQYPPGFTGIPPSASPQPPAAVPPKKRQRSSHAAELAELPEIPLRRRGRPAGDGATTGATQQELQERRMQANRAAASRSHFRRKREMEIMEKECTDLEIKVAEVRGSLAALMAQEEQLRLQQASIREHLAGGCRQAATQETAVPAVQAVEAAEEAKVELGAA